MRSRAVEVGVFIIVGIALFCAGLFLIGSSANLFGAHFVVYTQFNNVSSISKGATVRVAGMDAGQVAGIAIPKSASGEFRLKLSIDKKFAPIVRQDSMASIETQGFVGNQFVNVAKGTANSPQCTGCTLPSQEAVSMGALMRKGGALIGQIQGTLKHADVAVDNFASVGKNANSMIVAMKPKIDEMTANANAIVAGIREGHGTAGKLLTDKTVASEVSATVANAKQASANLAQTSHKLNSMIAGVQQNDMPGIHKTVDNAQQLTGRINNAVGTFLGSQKKNESTAKAINQTIAQAQQAAGNLADDTEALKTNFFLRGFFNRRGFYNLTGLTPKKYESSRFVKHPKARVWISGADLFASGPNGAPQLKDSGRTVLNARMSALVPYLPNNPIMVEGYSTYGAPDQQYLRSRERAIEVRNYLIQQFHLDPKFVGFIPLANRPPKKTGKHEWDGVCLVLVVQQRRHGLF